MPSSTNNYWNPFDSMVSRVAPLPPITPTEPPEYLTYREVLDTLRDMNVYHSLRKDSLKNTAEFVYRGHWYKWPGGPNADGGTRGPKATSNNYRVDWSDEPVTPKKNEDDMFASRKDDDGAFRLCVRRGRVIKSTMIGDSYKFITFDTAAKAKQCADELNDKYFDQYDKFIDRDNVPRSKDKIPAPLRNGMVETIMKYATLTGEVVGPTGN